MHGPKVHIKRRFSTSSATGVRRQLLYNENKGDITSLKLKVVCKNHCNSGWMSRLETRAQHILVPLFTGAPIIVNNYNQEVAATWIAMKLLTSEFSVPDDVVTPQLERTLLMGRRLPPDIMAIWIGHYKGAGWGNSYIRHAATLGWSPAGTIPTIPPGASFTKNVQAQTFTIGELFVQAVTTTVRQLKFQTPPPFAPYLKRIWPFQSEFPWPPSHAMQDFHANFIATGFDRFASSLPIAPGAASI